MALATFRRLVSEGPARCSFRPRDEDRFRNRAWTESGMKLLRQPSCRASSVPEPRINVVGTIRASRFLALVIATYKRRRSSSNRALLDFAGVKGMRPLITFSTKTLDHSFPFAEWIVESVRQSSSSLALLVDEARGSRRRSARKVSEAL